MGIIAAVLSGFLLAPAAPALERVWPRRIGWVLALLPLVLTFWFLAQIPAVAAGSTPAVSVPWAPALGVAFSFRIDGLALLFALLIAGIGTLVLIYTGAYLAGRAERGRCLAYLLVFTGSMLGVVLADDVVTLFVFWELTSISSFLLIALEHRRPAARRAAWQALMVTVLGGQALLIGLLLIGQIAGSLELSAWTEQGGVVRGSALYPAVLALTLLGAFTKSAQVPFHFWLANAMEAPTPVSAYLHSATMVKAGIYLLARLFPVLGGTAAWTVTLTLVGMATLVIGTLLALGQTDLKRILAYSTIGALGALTLLLGVGTRTAFVAAVVFLFAHALYKGALFLVAGAVDHETGSRDVRTLAGLRHALPITAGTALLAVCSMAGLPLFLGFIGKELIYDVALRSRVWPTLLTAATLAGLSFTVAAAFLTGIRPFFGRPEQVRRKPREVPPALWLGGALLAAAGLALGLMPGIAQDWLVAPAATAIAGAPVNAALHVWPGLQPALALSAFSLVAGGGLYAGRRGVRRAVTALRAERWGPARLYEVTEAGVLAVARVQTRVLQNGRLRYYTLTVFGTAAVLVGYTLLAGDAVPGAAVTRVRPYEAAVALMILTAALLAVRSASLLRAVISLGVVGFGVSLIFVLFGAPDLGMAQFLVETLTLTLFVLVFYRRPRFARTVGRAGRWRDALIAFSVGAVVTALVLVATRVQLQPPISGEYALRSVPEAHGRNVVNVVLTNFRALDTLGESVVLAVSAMGVYSLLRLRPGGQDR